MTDRVKEFTDRYPDTGPDAGTGPRSRSRCDCGHPIWAHHQLGACMVLVRIGVASPRYCLCLDYKEEQPT